MSFYRPVSIAEVDLTELDSPRGRSGSLLSAKNGSVSGTTTMAVTNKGTLLIPRPPSSCGSRRGSVILIDGRRGSLIPVPGQQVQVRRGSFVQFVADDRAREREDIEKIASKAVIAAQQSEILAEQILYKGQYRILNVSVIFIMIMIIFAIVFMSVWHYHDKEGEKIWVLYVALCAVVFSIGLNLLGIKLYFMIKRYHGTEE